MGKKKKQKKKPINWQELAISAVIDLIIGTILIIIETLTNIAIAFIHSGTVIF